jgi:hypothetical protein
MNESNTMEASKERRIEVLDGEVMEIGKEKAVNDVDMELAGN